MKTVCVAGAGPAGLVATKILLQSGEFKVSTYEKKNGIGGIWALDRDTNDGLLSPSTPTNLSRFLVAFSDLDWHSVDLSSGDAEKCANGSSKCEEPPMFPQAWMVNRYLETYRRRNIPDGVITYGCEILHAERRESGWRIMIRESSGTEIVRDFDYLIMATGFYAQPRPLNQDVQTQGGQRMVRILHSSAFRQLNDLFPQDRRETGGKILVIGGGNSSGETAASVAMQLSDSQWSPDQSAAVRYRDSSVVHITPLPIYPLPPFHELAEGSLSYVPLDYKLYDLSKRPDGMASYGGRQPKEVKDMVHKMVQSITGGDQSDISPALVSSKNEDRAAAQVALTEMYSEFVRSGHINVVLGRAAKITQSADGHAEASIDTQRGKVQLSDVAAIIYATGYTPCSSLEILDEKTRETLQYDPTAMNLPLILQDWQTHTPDIANLSFIGFYQGPYWGIVEMQARLTVQRWLRGTPPAVNPYESQQSLLELRRGMHERAKDVPQYGFSDYQGWMLDMATTLDVIRNDGHFGQREGSTVPARYLFPSDDRGEADATMKDLHQVWSRCVDDGRYVPRAVFRALQGDWNVARRIESALPTFPSGIFEGSASFHPRLPTTDRSGKTFDFEYLYVESGIFTTATGFTMTASRRYVYRYSEAEDQLSVWFVKPDNNLEVDYLFHNLAFVKPDDARKAGACIATADHLCIEDMYTTEYRLPLKGVSLRRFDMKHVVKGPQKDYVASTTYERQSITRTGQADTNGETSQSN